MTKPTFTRRDAQSLDSLLARVGGEGWGGLEDGGETIRPKTLEPEEDVSKFLFGLSRTPQGAALVDWLMDITFRAPFRSTGRTFEETALLASTRQGIEGVGEAILAAINHGAMLVERDLAAKET